MATRRQSQSLSRSPVLQMQLLSRRPFILFLGAILLVSGAGILLNFSVLQHSYVFHGDGQGRASFGCPRSPRTNLVEDATKSSLLSNPPRPASSLIEVDYGVHNGRSKTPACSPSACDVSFAGECSMLAFLPSSLFGLAVELFPSFGSCKFFRKPQHLCTVFAGSLEECADAMHHFGENVQESLQAIMGENEERIIHALARHTDDMTSLQKYMLEVKAWRRILTRHAPMCSALFQIGVLNSSSPKSWLDAIWPQKSVPDKSWLSKWPKSAEHAKVSSLSRLCHMFIVPLAIYRHHMMAGMEEQVPPFEGLTLTAHSSQQGGVFLDHPLMSSLFSQGTLQHMYDGQAFYSKGARGAAHGLYGAFLLGRLLLTRHIQLGYENMAQIIESAIQENPHNPLVMFSEFSYCDEVMDWRLGWSAGENVLRSARKVGYDSFRLLSPHRSCLEHPNTLQPPPVVAQMNTMQILGFHSDPDSSVRVLFMHELSRHGVSSFSIDADAVFMKRIPSEYFHQDWAMAAYDLEDKSPANGAVIFSKGDDVDRMLNNNGLMFLSSSVKGRLFWGVYIHSYLLDAVGADGNDFVIGSQRLDDQMVSQRLHLRLKQHGLIHRLHLGKESKVVNVPYKPYPLLPLTLQCPTQSGFSARSFGFREFPMAMTYFRGVRSPDDSELVYHPTLYGKLKRYGLQELGFWYVEPEAYYQGAFLMFDQNDFLRATDEMLSQKFGAQSAPGEKEEQWLEVFSNSAEKTLLGLLVSLAQATGLQPIFPRLHCRWVYYVWNGQLRLEDLHTTYRTTGCPWGMKYDMEPFWQQSNLKNWVRMPSFASTIAKDKHLVVDAGQATAFGDLVNSIKSQAMAHSFDEKEAHCFVLRGDLGGIVENVDVPPVQLENGQAEVGSLFQQKNRRAECC